MGCGRVGSTLALSLESQGHDVAVIDTNSAAFRRLGSSFEGKRVTGIGFDRDTLSEAGIEDAYAFAAVSNGDNSNILAARVARETYGVEHVVARIYDPGRAEIYQRLGIPTVGTVRWTANQMLRRLLPQGSVPEHTDPSGHVVIAVSDEVRRSMPSRHQASARTIVHGIDVDAVAALAADRDAVRGELGIAPDELLVVTVANFRAPKGYPDLLRAASLVSARRPDVRFVIVGQGPLEPELRAEHARLRLDATVDIVGYRPDAQRLTAAADLFVLASHHEGIPVAVMEALAAGVPVVATRVGGLAEAIDDGMSGRLVPVRRPDLLADAVVALAADPDARRHLSAGASAASARFSATRSAGEIEAVYDRALAASLDPHLRGRR